MVLNPHGPNGVADADRIQGERKYAETVVERIFEILLDLENLRGTGRLDLP